MAYLTERFNRGGGRFRMDAVKKRFILLQLFQSK